MSIYIDQLNRQVTIPAFPERIISLVPSQTELLFDLGLEERVIAITKFCIHPNKWFRNKQRIGGTKDFNIELIHSLQPDLILANKEENTEDGLNILMKNYPVWISDIKNLGDATSMINEIGIITNTTLKSTELNNAIHRNFRLLSNFISKDKLTKNRVAYLIWQQPFISVGKDTFISEMLKSCSLHPVFEHKYRYPETSIEELKALDIDFLFLSSEPFPFKEKHKFALEELFPEIEVVLVDGEYFSWYGSRLKNAPSYFQTLLSQLKNRN